MAILNEDKRSELISRGRRGEKEKGDGKNRYEKRINSRVASTVKEFNQIDMESLFKYSILTVNIPVQGETDNYLVRIKFGGFLDELHKILKQTNKFDLKSTTRALINCFDRDDVYIHCTCPDWQYRMSFWASMSKITSGAPENRPSKITNPRNSLGPGCKHVMLVLSNNRWVLKVASTIFNYINYMEKNRKKQYADIIYPAVYDKKYEEPVQLSFDDSDKLSNDTELIDTANIQGRTRGQFKPGNPYRFQKKPGVGVGQIPIQGEEE